MSKKATEFQRKEMSKMYRGKEIFKPLNTGWIDENLACLRFFKLMCATRLGKICASDHAMSATDEMSALNRDLEEFFDENGAEYPVWKELEKECGDYLK